MQRIRMSLPYFSENGWNAEVVMVNEIYNDLSKDQLLLKNIPDHIVIHKVKALSKKITSKFGLGSLGLRSIYFYREYVNKLLNIKCYDLIYFSTTEFSVTILGNYWKKKFNIPYVIDMQDPWHSTYYQDKPMSARPPKYWFSYRLNKYLEPIAMKNVNGLISVSQGYLETLVNRYPNLEYVPKEVITFGAYREDSLLVKQQSVKFKIGFDYNPTFKHFVYLGRGGVDMKDAVMILFKAFKTGLEKNFSIFDKARFHFIGTSYAPSGEGVKTIEPLADILGIGKYVEERTDRISLYDGLFTLGQADALVIVGSNDADYTASKIYPYIMAQKPIIAIFHSQSSANKILETCTNVQVNPLLNNEETQEKVIKCILDILLDRVTIKINSEKFANYSAEAMTCKQVELFNEVIKNHY